MELTYKEVTSTIKSKTQLYNILSTLYYLPDPSSKAVTRDYLLNYTYEPIPIFVMKKQEIIHHHYPYRKYSSAELLEILEDLLKSQKKNPTGLSIMNLPDQDWLRNAILHLDPKDPYHILKKEKAISGDDLNLTVNQEYS